MQSRAKNCLKNLQGSLKAPIPASYLQDRPPWHIPRALLKVLSEFWKLSTQRSI